MTSFPEIKYFLGANSPDGFYSLYAQLIDPTKARRIYILKGGPGCGKSTLMRRVAGLAEAAGQPVEYILCSGDPDSIDGVVFPQQAMAIVDGTAPHVVEPKLPGVVEQYVNLGTCYDTEGLAAMREEIYGCMTGYKACYQSAYRCLGAAASILDDVRSTLSTETLESKLAKRAKGILSREVPRQRKDTPGQVTQRFLGAVTHRGTLCLYDTAVAQCKKIYELSDRYGLSHLMLTHLLVGLTEAGVDVVACPDPMAPDRLAHLLAPELGLAFLSVSPALPFTGTPYRRIRIDGAVEEELLRRNRPRLRFAMKVSAALMDEATESLQQAKAMHDVLEGYYNPYVNFDQVDQVALSIAGAVLGDGGLCPHPQVF